MAPRPLRVFVSCTSELATFPESRSFAQAAAEAIRAAGATPVRARTTGSDRWERLGHVDLVLLVVGFRSGLDEMSGGHRVLSEVDLDHAARAGVPFVAVVLSENVVGPARLFRDPQYPGRQDEFRARLDDQPTASDPTELYKAVLAAITKHIRTHGGNAAGPVLRRLPPTLPRVFFGHGDLSELLREGRGPGVTVLAGPPGHGKSTIAAVHALTNADDYEVLWWISCTVPDAVPLALAELARALGSPAEGVTRALDDLPRLMRRHPGRCLVVLDDLSDAGAEAVRPVLDSGWEVLVTATKPTFDARETHWVTGLAPHMSVELLTLAFDQPIEIAEHVTSDMIGVPLALTIAGAFIRTFGYDQYRADFSAVQRESLRGKEPENTPRAARVAARLLLRALRRHDMALFRALVLAAWLGGDHVPIRVLAWDLDVTSGRVVPVRRRELTGGWLTRPLRFFGFVDVRTITLHPIIVAELRAAGEAEGGAEAWMAAASQVLLEEVRDLSGVNDSRSGWEFLIGQALAVHGQVQNLRSARPAVSEMLRDAARYLADVQADEPARRIQKDVRALERTGHDVIQGGALGALVVSSPITGTRSDRLTEAALVARTLRISGDLEGALRVQDEVVRLTLERYGPDDSQTFSARLELATLLREIGDDEQALARLEDLADRATTIMGEEHPQTLSAWSELAEALHDAGDSRRAMSLRQRVVSTSQRIYGRLHPRTLTAKTMLAADYLDLGDTPAARELADEAFEGTRRVLGPDHPDTLTAASTLAAVLSAVGDVGAARDLDQETYERYRDTLGEDDPATLLAANNLAGDLRLLGLVEQARDLDQDTVRRLRRVLGPDHPHTVRVAENLALDEKLLDQPRRSRRDTTRQKRGV
ncbi:tetratricopeptide repeat protein [Saccharothrix sp. NRRL B-16314]|uniref:tetratricopeptide repeat protein n=1 Tax=Saccharothrix sp. NRRL B-16314 TaxID=1463825 RepID=UPI0012DC4D10|nr:tetratricopeptide repeat protein [Saccharothrix sp. NRRL B-16314]